MEVDILQTNCDGNLFQCFGVELGEHIVFHGKAYFDGMAAHFAVFDIGLAWDGCVQDHRDFFATVGTLECVFHAQTVQYSLATGQRRGWTTSARRC